MLLVRGHDYYDGAGYGVDKSIVFDRDPSFINGEVNEMPFELPRSMDIRKKVKGGWKDVSTLKFFYVIIGGSVYPGMKVMDGIQSSSGPTKPDIFLYTPFATKDYVNCMIEDGGYFAPYFNRVFEINSYSDCLTTIQEFFDTPFRPEWTEWILDNKVVTGYIHDGELKKSNRHPLATINGDFLKDIDAFKIVDPFTAHMQIAGFISGVLAENRDIIELTDKDRIQKAGFDTKSSFRMPKGTKKPRRKNK